jgi:hypothetical protein
LFLRPSPIVGYGDKFPVTAIGEPSGAGVMVLGIGLFGLLAASLASLLIEKDLQKVIDPQIAEIGERGWSGWSSF